MSGTPASRLREVIVAAEPGEAVFDATDEGGRTVRMDLAGKLGKPAGRGFAARDLLLMALAGCSGASFLAELHRRGRVPAAVSITVRGELDTKPPVVFRRIAMHITATGTGLDEESMIAAAAACHGDCSVHATLSQVAAITTSWEARDESNEGSNITSEVLA
jgi:uncharacterized OsmC-like protein